MNLEHSLLKYASTHSEGSIREYRSKERCTLHMGVLLQFEFQLTDLIGFKKLIPTLLNFHTVILLA